MAAVLHRTTKQYVQSANTPDYPLTDWIHEPDLSAVVGYAATHWVITGDVVSLMSLAERDAIDAAEIESEKDNLAANLDRVLKAVVLVINDGSFIPGSNYTGTQLKAIIKAKL